MGKLLETIEIQHPEKPGYMVRINKCDYDPELHQLWNVKTEVAEDNVKAQKETGLREVKSYSQREAELIELYYGKSGEESNWRPIKAIADDYGIAKPEDGWDESIPLILAHEFGGET